MKRQAIGGTRARIWSIVKTIILFLLLVVYMLPFLMVLINAFKSNRTILREPLALIEPGGPIFSNFSTAWQRMDFLRAFCNSLFITVLSVALIVLITSMTAYFFVRADWKINKVFFALLIAAMIIPFQVIMTPLISIYGNLLNLLDHRLTLVFMHVGFSISMAVFIYHGFIKSNVPLSLEEAATLDGCSRTQTFFKVVFPLLKPTTATIIVLNVLAIWNDYLLPSLVLNKKELFTLPLSTYSFYGTYLTNYGAIMAGLMLTVLPVIILYLFLQRQIISGVIAGAVKA